MDNHSPYYIKISKFMTLLRRIVLYGFDMWVLKKVEEMRLVNFTSGI